MAYPPGWIVPQWPAPANVQAVCTTRSGGASQPPYDSLNVGDHVGDASPAVVSNRALFAETTGARPVFMTQVHGVDSVQIAADTVDGVEADGCVTSARNVACTIMVADCLPVLLAAANGAAVAAAHVGWRGLAGAGGRDILASVWDRFRALPAVKDPAQTLAWLGPCIGPDSFEVGPDVKAAFEAKDPAAAPLFRPHGTGKWLADLPGLARRRLNAIGVTRIYGNDGGIDWCTVANRSRFFSHRRDRVTGRFAAAIWLT